MREREIAATRSSLSRDLDELSDKVSPSRVVHRRTEAAKGKLTSVRDKVMGSASDAQHRAASATGSVGDSVSGTAQQAVGTVQSKTEGNPLVAGAVAFGAGMLLSSLLPASARETQAAQRAVDAAKDSGLVDEAKAAGQEMKDHLQDSAQQAAEEIKSTGADAAQHVKEEGQSSAETVKSEAQSG
ncbi:ElaB/YqjD/DUF883 family membrane-anchored ribosome-binding protein [Nocardioides thalensis]|uniref:ElaB/YqjD/DUF883 family membrane-anchored ribosome-binding protein n=1 Tax=Nocardioides thalensis TaxID=1914755 RepID=A0A853C900_9ACTN|nr:DUF3618 domain-containing protein [Nocardioides thalensis]NYJ02693.1 ElaB/YqjD/DUF883 family membrane-anchored ribosome-binding protein [Nocardioides thalensis]